eukprot:UN03642
MNINQFSTTSTLYILTLNFCYYWLTLTFFILFNLFIFCFFIYQKTYQYDVVITHIDMLYNGLTLCKPLYSVKYWL